MKICSQCNSIRALFEYHKNGNGLRPKCRYCSAVNSKIKCKKAANSSGIIPLNKKCNTCDLLKVINDFPKFRYSTDKHLGKCKECLKIERDNDLYRAKRRQERTKNKLKNNESQRIWYQKAIQKEPWRKVRKAVSKAIRCGLKRQNGSKHGESVFNHLPYTVEELKAHLESLWEPWMSWDNYGKYDPTKDTWQIDHIIPQSALPFSNMAEENFKKFWALSNLRPLETVANIRKSNKLLAA